MNPPRTAFSNCGTVYPNDFKKKLGIAFISSPDLRGMGLTR